MGKTRDVKELQLPMEHCMQRWAQKEDQNHMNLTETEDIKKWQEYTEELWKKKT